MAIWINDRRGVPDSYRTGGSGEIVNYECDTLADISNLPPPNGKNMGSTVLVLENATVHKLGSNPAAGINGWRQI